MSLLAILDRFQEGRGHMALVSRYSQETAASIKREVKKGLTQRLKERVGMGDSSSESESDSDDEMDGSAGSSAGSTRGKKGWRRRFKRKGSNPDVEKGEKGEEGEKEEKEGDETAKDTTDLVQEPTLPQSTWAKLLAPGREQAMSDDAVLAKDGANDVCLRVRIV